MSEVMNMMICPNCGNPYDETGKYCPCCGNAADASVWSPSGNTTYLFCSPEESDHINENAGKDLQVQPELQLPEPQLPEPQLPEPQLPAGAVSQQPIWVTQSLTQPHNGPLDESFLEVPGSEDFTSQQNPTLDILKSNTLFSDSAGPDIFDDVAESASTLFSMMSPKMKRFVISFIVGTLLSLIPIIYVACSSNSGSSTGSSSQATSTNILLPN
jgi:hypothetical protein